ncbi:MAG: hypothetical protein JRG91_12800, partial [Deltaproteobacteria bacterium]|nr:hypothetical protein [Deltaproteobacteria bacterium]
TMTDILIRNVDAGTLRRLRAHAAASGRSVQQELHEIVRRAVGQDPAAGLKLAARLREQLEGFPSTTDSTDIIREDRDRR